MVEQNKKIREVFQNEEIKLNELFDLFWVKKYVFLGAVIFSLTLGLLKFITKPIEYESVSIMLSEVSTEGGNMGQLGGLAGLAGINLSGMTNAGMNDVFSPELYPQLLESKSFLLDLINEEFFFKTKGRKMTIKDYYLEERPEDLISKSFDFVTGVPYILINSFKSEEESVQKLNLPSSPIEQQFFVISAEDDFAILHLKNNIKIDIEGRTIKLAVKMPEPLIAAELNNLIFQNIIEFVSNYKTEKQKANLEFIEESVIEAESNFKKAQTNLAYFRDSNQGIISQRAKTREEQLQAEFSLAFQVYSSLKQEFENSKIELKKNTPIFKTFEKAQIPYHAANPSLLKTVVIYAFIGCLLGVFLIFILLVKDYLKA